MYKNEIIEMFDKDIKIILYSALKSNENIRYTNNLRAIPLRTKAGVNNAYIVKLNNNNIYSIIINPDFKQNEYVDYKIVNIKDAIEKDIDIATLIEFISNNNKSEFINTLVLSNFNFLIQYNKNTVYNYIKSLLK